MSEKYSGQCHHGMPLDLGCEACFRESKMLLAERVQLTGKDTLRENIKLAFKTCVEQCAELTQLRADLARAGQEREELRQERDMLRTFGCKPAEESCDICEPLADMHTRAEAAEQERDTLKAECEIWFKLDIETRALLAAAEEGIDRNCAEIARLRAERDNMAGVIQLLANQPLDTILVDLRAQHTTSREGGYRAGLERAAEMLDAKAGAARSSHMYRNTQTNTEWHIAAHMKRLAAQIRAESSTLPRTYEQGAEDMRERVLKVVEKSGFNHCSCVDREKCASCGTVDEILEAIRALPITPKDAESEIGNGGAIDDDGDMSA